MSRIGKQPIPIPSGVKVAIENGSVQVEGPKGKLSTRLPEGVQVELKNGQLIAQRASDVKAHRANHGLARALLANAVTGVTEGFEKRLDVVGVGFRAKVADGFLNLGLGYSHPIQVPVPEGIEITVERGKKAIQQY
ncbi:MAG: 50S ribosomal protein L6, partial [Acidobacteriota bacterium]